jgi:hypothetical protein
MLKPIGAKTPDEYIQLIEEPRRSDIRALHSMITKALPKLAPVMQYGMIGYGSYHYKYASGREGDGVTVALASQKRYISVYIGGAEQHKAELPKASIGKSCIRFEKLSDIDLKVLEKLVKLAAKAKMMAKSAQA